MLPLAWLMVWGGAYLAFSAVRGRKPTQDLTNALQGRPNAPSAPLGAGSLGGEGTGTNAASSTSSTSSGSSGSGGPPVDRSACVSIDTRTGPGAGKGGYGRIIWLIPAAATAYQQWCAAYGAVIPIGEGWRSVQAANDGAAKDPARFADGATSWHCKGKAVDVDNDWMSRLSPADLSRLRRAAKSAGWGSARGVGEANCGNNPTNDNEPWHFSHGGCG